MVYGGWESEDKRQMNLWISYRNQKGFKTNNKKS